MAREFLMIVQESAFKTPVSGAGPPAQPVMYPTAAWDATYVWLDGGNAFTMRPKMLQQTLMFGGGLATPLKEVSGMMSCKGQLKLKLCASQAGFFLNWALTPVNAAQTQPWTTTINAGDLASCAVYHAIQRSDGTYKRRVYLGTKVQKAKLECAAEENNQTLTLTLDLIASTPQGNAIDSSVDPTATVFPAPANNQYATDPYLFIHSGGNLTIGSARTQFRSISLEVENVIDERFFESQFRNILQFLGRKSKMEVELLYKASPDDRTTYEAMTSQTATLAFNNTAHTTTVNFNAQNVMTNLDDDTDLEKVYTQKMTFLNHYDTAAGADLAVTYV